MIQLFADITPQGAIDTLSSTLLGALIVILVFVSGYLLKLLLKEKDNNAIILREVLTAVNNFVEVQKEINDRERRNNP